MTNAFQIPNPTIQIDPSPMNPAFVLTVGIFFLVCLIVLFFEWLFRGRKKCVEGQQ